MLRVKKTRKWVKPIVVALVVMAVGLVYIGLRAYRTVSIGHDMYTQVRYLVANGGSIGEVPAEKAFSLDFLQVIFGDNPELLRHLKALVSKGLADDPALHLGEVAAMLVTYQTDTDGAVSDVVFYAIGGFPLTRRKPSLHTGGYFFQQLDQNLWQYGNVLISFFGRDIVMFAEDEEISARQEEIVESLLSGEIMPLVNRIAKPMHFTMVLPEPRHIIPRQLKPHMRTIVLKGFLSHYKGKIEAHILSPSPRSASYALSSLRDLKLAAKLTLRTRFHGVERETLWGPVRNPWWAYEMAQALEHSEFTSEASVVKYNTEFERVMVNAILKTIERFSRDLAAMRLTQDERLDPRLVDAKLRTAKPLHYWSESHQWGPDWPIPPAGITNVTEGASSTLLPQTETSSMQADPSGTASAL
jgi:hypothetical protein